jgi:hypothetical protein
MLCDDGAHWNLFIHDWFILSSFTDVFVKGKAKNKLFGRNPIYSSVIALYIDFSMPAREADLAGFCTNLSSGCSVVGPIS